MCSLFLFLLPSRNCLNQRVKLANLTPVLLHRRPRSAVYGLTPCYQRRTDQHFASPEGNSAARLRVVTPHFSAFGMVTLSALLPN